MRSNYPDRTVYLAGTITGLDHDGARFGWRKELEELLESFDAHHIHCVSPMRGKGFLQDAGVLDSSNQGADHDFSFMTTPSAITTRDYNDVRMCDAMVACFLDGNNHPSLGTAAEYGYCWALHKPVITIGPADDVNVKHLMLQRMTGYYVDNLEDAAMALYQLLTPGI